MYDTNITVLGNVATNPQHRELTNGSLTDFRVASTSRRYDKRLAKWVDGDELFIKVSCWRALGEHVYRSVKIGDPVIIRGRLYSRRTTDDSGSSRYFYEVNAQAVGHDLSRGVGQFVRRVSKMHIPEGGGSSTERSEFDAVVNDIEQPHEDSLSDLLEQPALVA